MSTSNQAPDETLQATCKHEHFSTRVDIRAGEDIRTFLAEITAWCTDCHTPFSFSDVSITDTIREMLSKPVPFTLAMDDEFRDIYCQGYHHALTDVLHRLEHPAPHPKPERNQQPENPGC
jgi:hypothetical protein